MASGARFAGLLRHELRARNLEFARNHRLAHQLSYGEAPVVCYEPEGAAHGNFLPETYAAIVANAAWSKRLKKIHTSGRTSLPRNDRGFWAELDSCNSSDALLMNVFCYPGVFDDGRVLAMLGVSACEHASGGAAEFVSPPRQRWERLEYEAQRRGTMSKGNSETSPARECREAGAGVFPESPRDDTFAVPEFGVRARVPLLGGKFDRTEVDMRLGSLLVEAKLTEADFQSREREFVNAYRDFSDVFHRRDLPQTRDRYLSYQLIRNVLAAHALDCSFCVLHDARRPDLRDAWYDVMKCVKLHDLRLRCKVLTWQELAAVLPALLQSFLEEKYGITAHL